MPVPAGGGTTSDVPPPPARCPQARGLGVRPQGTRTPPRRGRTVTGCRQSSRRTAVPSCRHRLGEHRPGVAAASVHIADPALDLHVHRSRGCSRRSSDPRDGRPPTSRVALSPDLYTGWGERSSSWTDQARTPSAQVRPSPVVPVMSPGSPHVDTCGRWTTRASPGDGDGPAGFRGRRGGETPTTVQNCRVVHVSTQVRGSGPTAGQQGETAVDLREGRRSPASTPVMTKMSYICRGVLEPHSGWGVPGRAPPAARHQGKSTLHQGRETAPGESGSGGLVKQGGARGRMTPTPRRRTQRRPARHTSKGWITR